MHFLRVKLSILVCSMLLSHPSSAQNKDGQVAATSQTQAPGFRYRTLSVVDQSNLERALNRNGADGYRLIALNASSNGNITAVMEKTTSGSFQYKVILGAWAHLRIVHNDTPIVELLNEAGQAGFRFVPNSVLPGKDVSAAVVVEHMPDSTAHYRYRIYSPQLPTNAKFERDFAQGRREGFSLVFYGTAGRGPSTLMENQDRASEPARTDLGDMHRFECSPKDLLEHLQKEVDRGFVPFAISPWNDFSALKVSFWVERTSGMKLRVVSFENKSGADMSLLRGAYEGLVGELNKASADGYSLLTLPIISRGLRGSILAKFAWRLAVVTKHGPAETIYRVVAAETLPELNGQINAAAGEGFRVIPGSLIGETAILMERSSGGST